MDNKKLWVVGIGPGSADEMTVKARNIIEGCRVIAGYSVYCDLLRPSFPDKEYIETPMTGEEKRVELALKRADEGGEVALVCSGDAGVYGLAGLAVEKKEAYPEVEVEVVSGVTAALSGGALLGAPLIHDFCVISLSDRLTPKEKIERRLLAAAEADMVIVIYNPESRSRKGYLSWAADVLMRILPGDRICGIARNIGRSGEGKEILVLSDLADAQADMFSTVFIGNSSTKRCGSFMVTERGYGSER